MKTVELEKMSDDELLELSRQITSLRAARQLKDMPKYSFTRWEDLKKVVDVWFGNDIGDEVKGEIMYKFIDPALYKFTDYITGNYELKYRTTKDNEVQTYVFSTNSVKADKVKKYKEIHDALVDYIVELTTMKAE